MGVAMEVARFSHRKIDKRSTNPGQRAYNPIDGGVSPCIIRLGNFENARKERVKEGSNLSRITVGECLIPNTEPSSGSLILKSPMITPTRQNSVARVES